MQVRRFLGKIAGTYLAIGALTASVYAVADTYPGQGPVSGWGNAPSYGEPVMGGSHPEGMGGEPVWGGPQSGFAGGEQGWGGPHSGVPGGEQGWGGPHSGYHQAFGEQSWGGPGSGCAPKECCKEDCHVAPECGIAYNPSAYFNCTNYAEGNSLWDRLRFRADFLWWRASEDHLILGSEETRSSFPNGAVNLSSKIKAPNFKYDPGFRIGLSTVSCDCWDVALNWTHFHTKAHATGTSTFAPLTVGSSLSETQFVSAWERNPLAVPDVAKGRWTLNLDVLDLEFGHKFYSAKCFILRPHLGLRGVRIDQNFRVEATGSRVEAYAEGGDAFFTSSTKAKNNFLAIGPRLGLDVELKLPCNVSLFGQAAGSLVFGRFERHSREDFEDLSLSRDAFTTSLYHAKPSHDRSSRAITDLAIGLKWEHCCEWCNRQHPLSIAVSWEHHAFYDLNNFSFEQNIDSLSTVPVLKGRSCCGDLTTQGLTVSAEIGF